MAAAIARHVGARHVVITDVNDYRLGLAMRMGATRTVNVQRESLRDIMTELGMTEGFDVGMEMSGVPEAFRDMFLHMNHGGKVALLGIPPANMAIDWNQVIFKGLEIKGIYGARCSRPGTRWSQWCKAASISRRSSRTTTRSDEFEKAFATMLSGSSGKVVLDWAA
jgi:threonine 3-dehydrogenase